MKSKLKYVFRVLLLMVVIMGGVEVLGEEPVNYGGIRSQRRERRSRTETTTNTNRTNTNNSNRNNSNSGRSSNSGNNRRQSQQTTQPTQPAVQQSVQPAPAPQPAPTPSKPTTGYINGHEWVDLGLPSGLKWATCNVGASTPSDYGDYFAWGETTIKSSYTSDNCKTWEKNIGNIGGNISYDAARANWGSSWRMPTQSEFEELLNNCTWTWTSQGGHNGYKVKSKKNGNSIFLPAAGFRHGSSLSYAGGWGGYWSSTPDSSSTQDAFRLYFTSGDLSTNWNNRGYGQSVRAVSE